MARLDDLEAHLTEIERRLMEHIDARQAAIQRELMELRHEVETLAERVGSEGYATRQEARDRVDEAFGVLDELVEDARRRERLTGLAEARAAIAAGERKRGKAS